jgi:hypothetical protein
VRPLLLGGPGTGKSTVPAWLSRRFGLSPRYFLGKLGGGEFLRGRHERAAGWQVLRDLDS